MGCEVSCILQIQCVKDLSQQKLRHNFYFWGWKSSTYLRKYSLNTFKWHKSNIKNLLVKSSEIVFIIWQIKLISHRSYFWHLSRKPAVKFSKWTFFQNSLKMSWAIWSGKMQVKKINLITEFSINKFLMLLLCHIYMCSDYSCQKWWWIQIFFWKVCPAVIFLWVKLKKLEIKLSWALIWLSFWPTFTKTFTNNLEPETLQPNFHLPIYLSIFYVDCFSMQIIYLFILLSVILYSPPDPVGLK